MRIQNLKIWMLSTILGVFGWSCIEETDTSLFEEGTPELVIEGGIHNGEPPYFISISRSVAANSHLSYVPVSIAKVIIENNQGEIELLKPVSPGLYKASQIKGKEGVFYTLRVDIDNELYSAHDTMPKAPAIDTVAVQYKDEFPYEEGYYLSIQTKTNNIHNSFYRLQVAVNDSMFNAYSDLIVFEGLSDREGQLVTLPYVFESEDRVMVKMTAITKEMYDYYNGLLKQTTNFFSNIQPPLLNPPSNISHNPLGYFQVAADTTIYLVMEQ